VRQHPRDRRFDPAGNAGALSLQIDQGDGVFVTGALATSRIKTMP